MSVKIPGVTDFAAGIIMKTIRWGILSTARIAHQFAEDFAWVNNDQLMAVASRSQQAAREFAAHHGIPTAHAGYARLYADPDIDAIYVATPHALHLQNSSDALRAGKAVLCEKPLTVSVDEADELKRVSQATGSYLMEAMWTWFLPAIQQALAWYEAGKIGKLLHIKSDFGHPILPYSDARREYNRELGGGVVADMGIYPIAIAYLFTRQDPVKIQVRAAHAPNGVEDDVAAIFTYQDCRATMSASFRCRLPNATHVIGDRGQIVIPDFWAARTCHLYRDGQAAESFVDERASHGYHYEAVAVGEDLLAGRRESPVMPLDVSRKLQEHIALVRAQC